MKRRSYRNNSFYKVWEKKKRKTSESSTINNEKKQILSFTNPLSEWFKSCFENDDLHYSDTYRPLFISKGTLSPIEKDEKIISHLKELCQYYNCKTITVDVPYNIEALDSQIRNILTVKMKKTLFLIKGIDGFLKLLPKENNFSIMLEKWFKDLATSKSCPIIFTVESYNPYIYMLRSYCQVYNMGYEAPLGQSSFPSNYRKIEYLLMGSSEGKKINPSVSKCIEEIPFETLFRNIQCSDIDDHDKMMEMWSEYDTLKSWNYYLEAKSEYDNEYMPLLCQYMRNRSRNNHITDAKKFTDIEYNFELKKRKFLSLEEMIEEKTLDCDFLVDKDSLNYYKIYNKRKEFEIPQKLKRKILNNMVKPNKVDLYLLKHYTTDTNSVGIKKTI